MAVGVTASAACTNTSSALLCTSAVPFGSAAPAAVTLTLTPHALSEAYVVAAAPQAVVAGQAVVAALVHVGAGRYSLTHTFSPPVPKWPSGFSVSLMLEDGGGGGGVVEVADAVVVAGRELQSDASDWGFSALDASTGVGLCVGDVTGDGVPDVLVVRGVGDTNTLFVSSDGGATFAVVSKPGLDGASATAVYGCTMADANADGRLDVYFAVDGGNDELWVHTDAGFTEQASALSISTAGASRGVAWADMSGDGAVDVTVCTTVSTSMYFSPGVDAVARGEPFGTASPDNGVPSGSPCHQPLAADIDGDGDVDILLYKYNAASTLMLNDGSGTFSFATPSRGFTDTLPSVALTCADADNDGDLDVFGTAESHSLMLWRNAGQNTGHFSREDVLQGVVGAMAVGDVDLDGDVDVVGSYSGGASSGVFVALNGGGGQFYGGEDALGSPTSTSSVAMVVADLDAGEPFPLSFV